MTAPLTPGAYLKMRRQAALMSVVDVAASITTVPHTAEHQRGEWLELIEADAAPAAFSTIVALRRIYRFDIEVLFKLEAIAQGAEIPHPPLCSVCACSDAVACAMPDGGGCYWVEGGALLCSACPPASLPESVGA